MLPLQPLQPLQDRDIDDESDLYKEIQKARDDLAQAREAHANDKGSPMHPLRLVHDIQVGYSKDAVCVVVNGN